MLLSALEDHDLNSSSATSSSGTSGAPKSVYLDLLTSRDLEMLRQRADRGPPTGSPPASSPTAPAVDRGGKRYLILTYHGEFDKVHYPLSLTPDESINDPGHMRDTIRQLKEQVQQLKSSSPGSAGGRTSPTAPLVFSSAASSGAPASVIGEECGGGTPAGHGASSSALSSSSTSGGHQSEHQQRRGSSSSHNAAQLFQPHQLSRLQEEADALRRAQADLQAENEQLRKTVSAIKDRGTTLGAGCAGGGAPGEQYMHTAGSPVLIPDEQYYTLGAGGAPSTCSGRSVCSLRSSGTATGPSPMDPWNAGGQIMSAAGGLQGGGGRALLMSVADVKAHPEYRSVRQQLSKQQMENRELADQKSRASVEHRKEVEAVRKELAYFKNQCKRLQQTVKRVETQNDDLRRQQLMARRAQQYGGGGPGLNTSSAASSAGTFGPPPPLVRPRRMASPARPPSRPPAPPPRAGSSSRPGSLPPSRPSSVSGSRRPSRAPSVCSSRDHSPVGGRSFSRDRPPSAGRYNYQNPSPRARVPSNGRPRSAGGAPMVPNRPISRPSSASPGRRPYAYGGVGPRIVSPSRGAGGRGGGPVHPASYGREPGYNAGRMNERSRSRPASAGRQPSGCGPAGGRRPSLGPVDLDPSPASYGRGRPTTIEQHNPYAPDGLSM